VFPTIPPDLPIGKQNSFIRYQRSPNCLLFSVDHSRDSSERASQIDEPAPKHTIRKTRQNEVYAHLDTANAWPVTHLIFSNEAFPILEDTILTHSCRSVVPNFSDVGAARQGRIPENTRRNTHRCATFNLRFPDSISPTELSTASGQGKAHAEALD
jgi:hypothetical protein